MRLGGEKVRRVVLEKKTTTYDEYNQPVESWNPDTAKFPGGVMYAEKWDQGGKETTDGQVVAYSDVRFKCRYIEDLDPANNREAAGQYRLKHNERIYDIEQIKEIGRREGLILITEAQDNQ